MAQLYVSQEMLADFKEEFGLIDYKICELGGNLVLPEYRGNGITTKLQTVELELAKELNFDYIIAMAHPNNIGSCKTLEKVGLEFVKETTLSNGFLRKLYMLKLK
jgi:RimJ/RimL family protein N-acetyltransferase